MSAPPVEGAVADERPVRPAAARARAVVAATSEADGIWEEGPATVHSGGGRSSRVGGPNLESDGTHRASCHRRVPAGWMEPLPQ